MRKALIALAAIALTLSMSAPAASAPASTSGKITHRMQLRAVWDGEVKFPDCPLDQISPPDTGSLIYIDEPTLCWYGPVHGDRNAARLRTWIAAAVGHGRHTQAREQPGRRARSSDSPVSRARPSSANASSKGSP